MKFAAFKASFLAGLLALANTFFQSVSLQPRKTEAKRGRAVIETAVNFVMGTTAENPLLATLHLKNVGSREATQVRLLNSVGISADEPTKAENATFEHAMSLSARQNQLPVIGNIDVGQRDSMELHVPKLVPSQFALLKRGRSHVYVAGILNYEDAHRSYELDFCWVFNNGDPAPGHKCRTHNEQKDLGPTPRSSNQKSPR